MSVHRWAEREASIVELRRALERGEKRLRACSFCQDEPELDSICAALAQPAPQAALRAMLVKAVEYQRTRTPACTAEEVADAVLKGES